MVAVQWRSPTLAAPRSRRRESNLRSFLNQAAFELSQSGKDIQDEFAGRRRRVDQMLSCGRRRARRLTHYSIPAACLERGPSWVSQWIQTAVLLVSRTR